MGGQQPEAPAIPVVTREQVREMVSAAIERALWDAGSPPASEAVMEVVWPLLERAQADGAKLAAIAAYCRNPGHAYIGHLMAERILAIVGSEEPGDGD